MITRRERLISLTAAVSLPLSVMLALLLTTIPKVVAPEERRVAVFDVPSANATVPPKPRPKPIVKPKPAPIPPVPLPVPAEPVLPPQVVALLAEASAQAGACDLTAPVEAALRADPAIADAVATIPRDSRSVANAILLWNQDWLAPDEIGSGALPTIRDTIVATIEAATPECRNAVQTGPRFMPLDDAGATIVVVGSDEWRWQDLVDSSNISKSVSFLKY